jgi:dienelactone hydrolase
MHAMESFLSPSPSISTTIFYKPLWLIQFVFAAVPFFIKNGDGVIKPRIWKFHEAVRNDPETSGLKLGSAGFCWGGKYTTLLCHEEKMIDVGFTAHPSKMKYPQEWDMVKKPLSIAIGDVDMGINISMVRNIKTLLEKKEHVECEVTIYPGAKHGFAVRANAKDEGQSKSAVEAEKQAVSWFTKWFA